jgi:hypothetical protein
MGNSGAILGVELPSSRERLHGALCSADMFDAYILKVEGNFSQSRDQRIERAPAHHLKAFAPRPHEPCPIGTLLPAKARA